MDKRTLGPEKLQYLGALQVDLTADDLAAIDTAAAAIMVQGERHPEAMQKMVDR